MTLGDPEVDTAHAIYQDIRAGQCDALHLRDAAISWSEHTLCLTLPEAGATIHLRTTMAEPWLEHSLALDDITRGAVTFFNVDALGRYVQAMEQESLLVVRHSADDRAVTAPAQSAKAIQLRTRPTLMHRSLNATPA